MSEFDLFGSLGWENDYEDGQSTIPPEFEEVTISDMLEGEEAYIVYWAIFADKNGRVWINSKYTFGNEGGTRKTKIKRDGIFILVDKSTFNGKLSPGSSWEMYDKMPVKFVDGW